VNEGEAEQLAQRLIDLAEGDPHRGTDVNEQMQLDALAGAGRRLKQLMDRTPWSFVPPNVLTGIQGAFDPVIASVESHATAAEATPLGVTWQSIHNLWNALTPLVAMSLPEESVAEDATSFRRSAAQLIRRLTEEVELGQREATQLREQLAAVETGREEAVAELRRQQAALEATITQQATRLEQAIRDNQAQFTAAQNEQQAAAEANLKEQQAALAALVGSVEGTVKEKVDAAHDEAAAVLKRIEAIEEKAAKSYNATGNATVAGAFQELANKQKRQADLWRIGAVLAFLAVAVAAVVELSIIKGNLSAEDSLARLPIGLALAALATVSLRESHRHRDIEQEARRREIELTSIDAYLVHVEDRERVEDLKLAHARVVFIGHPSDDQPPEESEDA